MLGGPPNFFAGPPNIIAVPNILPIFDWPSQPCIATAINFVLSCLSLRHYVPLVSLLRHYVPLVSPWDTMSLLSLSWDIIPLWMALSNISKDTVQPLAVCMFSTVASPQCLISAYLRIELRLVAYPSEFSRGVRCNVVWDYITLLPTVFLPSIVCFIITKELRQSKRWSVMGWEGNASYVRPLRAPSERQTNSDRVQGLIQGFGLA